MAYVTLIAWRRKDEVKEERGSWLVDPIVGEVGLEGTGERGV